MFLSPPFQLLPFYGFSVILLSKLKNEVLYNVAHMLVSVHVLANAVTFYVLCSLITGNWNASSNGISPLRWLACLALPTFMASRGLRKRTVTSSGAIAVLQIGFLLTMANLSYTLCFAAYLMWHELSLKNQTKTYLNVLCEMGLPIHIAVLHLLEIGAGGNSLSITGPEGPLDFRTNFLQTSLGISLMGSLSVSLGETLLSTLIKSSLKGGVIGLAYWVGVVIAAGGVATIPQGKAFALAPNQLHIIGLGIAGGVFGALWSRPLRALIWPAVRNSDPPPPEGDHYGLSLLSGFVGGLLLPRFALAMDATHLGIWESLAALSSFQ